MSEPIHDFAAKLRQPSLQPAVERYVAWRRQVERARAAGDPAPPPPALAPISVNIDLTSACNYRCDHCIDWEVLNSPERHRDDQLRRSVTTLAERGLRSVILIGGGEPTLYPGFADFVRFLKSVRSGTAGGAGDPLDVAIVSNGSRGDRLREAADALGPRDWIRLSLDAATDETFRALHRPARRDLGLDEICDHVGALKRRRPEVRVGWSFLIVWRGASRNGVPLRDNIDEIPAAARRAKAAGFDSLSLKPVLDRTADGAEVIAPGTEREEHLLERIRAAVDEARTVADTRFTVHASTNLRVLLAGTWRDYTRQPRRCHMQAFRQVLTPEGLYNCPAHRGVPAARLGDRDAWAGEAAASATRARLAAGIDGFDASRACREVTCLYNAVNWWLEEAIEAPGAAAGSAPCGTERGDHFL